MAHRLVTLLLFVAGIGTGIATLGACGKEIGDACSFGTDCDPNGGRSCIDATVAGGDGYCTIQGCDFSTCPDEAVCVQFFSGNFSNKPCDPALPSDPAAAGCTAEVNCCSLDELCSVAAHCVPRSSEVRYCMRTCSADSDCREGYECRDFERMKLHGGQPVLTNGESPDATAPKFCAKAPS